MQETTINALVSPEGSLEILSNHEVNRLKDRSEGGLYRLFRQCALAVLNTGIETDDCKALMESHADFDVMLLDVSLPRIDGLEVASRIREQGNATPILMLTARDAIEDRVIGLDAGADDYVVKPFALVEVAARVRVLSRRRTGEVQRLSVGSLELLINEHRVRREGREIELSPIGWRLLETLARSSPAPVDRGTLSFAAWGDEPPLANNLKVQMFKLRKTIDKPFSTSIIRTVKGHGYCLRVNSTSDN